MVASESFRNNRTLPATHGPRGEAAEPAASARRQLVSAKTRQEFREWFVGTSLGHISDEFDAAELPRDKDYSPTVRGERRALVEQYYHAIDFSDWNQVRKVLLVYEHVLYAVEELVTSGLPSEREFGERKLRALNRCLARDGFLYDGTRITPRGVMDGAAALGQRAHVVDAPYLWTQIERMQSAVEADPALAIGTAKEIIETTCKSILRERGVAADSKWDVLELVKHTRKRLRLTPEDIPDTAKAAKSIRTVLNSLASVVHGIAELRSPYGTGHGPDGNARGLTPRHARLVAGAAASLAAFLLETHMDRD
jgi:hypothetical protein